MPQNLKIVFGDIPFTPEMERHFGELAGVVELVHPGRSSAQAIEEARADACVWVSRTAPVADRHLQAMRNVKMLSAWGVGYDHIDISAATAYGIPVCINPFFSRSVAEAALTLLFALSKRLRQHMQDIGRHGDPGHITRGTECGGKTLGIIGFGRIGRELAEIASRLDMQIVACDPYIKQEAEPNFRFKSLSELLAESDFVVLTSALTAETKNMIDSAALARMKRSAYLINVGRGGLVDESALLIALQQEQIAGAGLDVWAHEPVRPDNPLLAFDNVIGTPHRLAATWESLERVCQGITKNALRVLKGEPPLDVVNSAVLAQWKGAQY